jgi:hypothetical protein
VLSQYGVHREIEVGQSPGSKTLTAPDDAAFLIAAGSRHPVEFHPFRRKVHQPDLGDAEPRVQRKLRFAITVDGGLCHLDEEQDIRRTGVSLRIEILPGPQQSEVRLRLRMLPQSERVLDTHNCSIANELGKQPIQPINNSGVTTPDRGHQHDLAIKKLHSIIFREHAGPAHTMEFFHREQPSG